MAAQKTALGQPKDGCANLFPNEAAIRDEVNKGALFWSGSNAVGRIGNVAASKDFYRAGVLAVDV